MSKLKKRPHTSTIILASALVTVTAALIVVLVLLISGSGNKYKVEKGNVVVTIDGTKLYENQFRFFATLLLDQENTAYRLSDSTSLSDLNDKVKNETMSFAKEYIFRLREAQEAGFKLTDAEVQDLEDTFDTEYEERKVVGTRTLKGDEFYDYYYGLTKKQFVQFWKDWTVIEKYNTYCEKNADTSDTNQEKAYEEYEDYLAGCNTTVLLLSLTDITEDECAAKRTLASELSDKIQSGGDMAKLIEQYCEDETLKESNGVVRITKSHQASFPELYEWSVAAGEGDLSVIETKTAIYIVRCDSFEDYDSLYNTEELLEWTRLFAVNEQTARLLQSNKYSVTVEQDIYTALDLSSLIEAAQAQWG